MPSSSRTPGLNASRFHAKHRSGFFKEQLHELEMIRREHADSSNRRLVKELEKAKKRLEAKLQTLAAEHKKRQHADV
jgi:hypothetical protein